MTGCSTGVRQDFDGSENVVWEIVRPGMADFINHGCVDRDMWTKEPSIGTSLRCTEMRKGADQVYMSLSAMVNE